MIFTILTFRALGRTHIASEPCVAIAMLCFDSTVGFPWSVPVLTQQLPAGGWRPFAPRGTRLAPPPFCPSRDPRPPEGGQAPLPGTGTSPGGLARRVGRGAGRGPPPLGIRKRPDQTTTPPRPALPPGPSAPPSTPAFGSKPSLTLRRALSQAPPRPYLCRLTPSADLGPSARPGLRKDADEGQTARESAPGLRGTGAFRPWLVFRPRLGQPPALLSEPLLLPKLRS